MIKTVNQIVNDERVESEALKKMSKVKLLPSYLKPCLISALFLLGTNLYWAPDSFSQNTNEKPGNNTSESSRKTQSKKNNSKSSPAPTYSASKPSKHVLGLGLGQTFLLGKFNSLGDDKITFDFYYYYQASHSFELVLNFHNTEHSLNDKEAQLTSLNMAIKSKIFDFDSFAPYLLGGLGFYRPQVKRSVNGVLTESEAKDVLGLNAGAGMELTLNKNLLVGILTHFHSPFRVKQDNQPAVSGYYFKLLMTLGYRF